MAVTGVTLEQPVEVIQNLKMQVKTLMGQIVIPEVTNKQLMNNNAITTDQITALRKRLSNGENRINKLLIFKDQLNGNGHNREGTS